MIFFAFFFLSSTGALSRSMVATSESLGSAFSTEFADAQDLTAHALLSFNLFKVHSPAHVVVELVTPHGTYRTPAAALFEQANTITVDLASSEFASTADATVFDEPIVGLSAVQSITLRFVAAEIGAAQVTVDSMLVCAAPAAAVAADQQQQPVASLDAAPLEFPDVASLSTALSTAIGEAQRLATEVAELKNAQRHARRSFDEFSASVHDTLEKAVAALTGAMGASVEQTLTNSKLLQRLRERINDATAKHEERLARLDEQFATLRSLAKHVDTPAEPKHSNEKRSTIVAQALAVEPLAPAAVAPLVGESFGLSINNKAARQSNAAPLVRAP
jgi:hypothetical protein